MILTLAGVVLVVAGVEGARWWYSDHLLRCRSSSKIVVELASGDTFQGVLAGSDQRTLVLRNVSVLSSPETVPTVVDGELLIPRGDIKFVQRP